MTLHSRLIVVSSLACAMALALSTPARAEAASPDSGSSSKPAAIAPTPRPTKPLTDHPLVKRFAGARILEKSVRALDEYWLATGKLIGDGQAERAELLEGKWTHFVYSNPENRSLLEIAKRYETAFLQAGFDTVYSCKDDACGEGGRKTNGDWWPISEPRRYLVAHLARPGGDVWVGVHVHAPSPRGAGRHEVDIIETRVATRPADAEPVAPTAASLAEALATHGHAAIHAFEFESGTARLLPTSAPALEAVAGLLARDPTLRLHVVVHTDRAGDVGREVQLSRRRAASVIEALARNYRVSPKRLRPDGVGPLAPLASNRTDEDRARNRRVELIPY